MHLEGSLFPDGFDGIDGFDDYVSLVPNAVPGMELLDDFAEARIGEGVCQEDQRPEKCEDRWTKTNDSTDRC